MPPPREYEFGLDPQPSVTKVRTLLRSLSFIDSKASLSSFPLFPNKEDPVEGNESSRSRALELLIDLCPVARPCSILFDSYLSH